MSDLAADFMEREAPAAEAHSVAKAWLRALERTAPIAKNPVRILPVVIEEAAQKFGEQPALLSKRESFSYSDLVERSNQYARCALDLGVKKGDVIGLLMPNRPEYVALWLGITRVGGVVALLNTNLTGALLAHSVNAAQPKHLIVATELADNLKKTAPYFGGGPTFWFHGSGCEGQRIDRIVEGYSGESLAESEPVSVTIEDPALYIYTSGTTGSPKAAKISHGRLMQWSHWFAALLDTQPTDRLYNCLPIYHSTGGVLATVGVLVAGGSVVVREKFSAGEFWRDVVSWDCTLFQYVGELCRYLLKVDPDPAETRHRIRMCCGNGLRPEVWEAFQRRFAIPRILEFYASTEGNVSLFNVEGERGALGRVPPYLGHANPMALIQIDVGTGAPIRNEHGFCVRCANGESGEALGRLRNRSSNLGARFEGYTDREATQKKILRNVFEPGDAWYRTGDLMRQDEQGYFYFVDRFGDTFRWKGENISTAEVSGAICEFPGVQQAVVYGVPVPGAEGRAGMATLSSESSVDLAALRRHMLECLPGYAVPVFLRLRNDIELSGTFKPLTNVLQREGYDPAASSDSIWFHDREKRAFVRLDQELYERIQRGQIRF